MSFKTRKIFFKRLLLLAAKKEWNNRVINIPNSFSNNMFNKESLNFKRPESNIACTIHYTKGLVLCKVAA